MTSLPNGSFGNTKMRLYTLYKTMKEKKDNYPPSDTLKDFQYRPFIKSVYILLPGYKYRHTTSDMEDNMFVGRESVREKFLDYLRKGGSKGAYLITGYRGMGKTTLVNQVIKEYLSDKKNKRDKISISFGQKNISEMDILRQMVYEIKNYIEKNNKNSIFSDLSMMVIVAVMLVSGLTFCYFLNDLFYKKIDFDKVLDCFGVSMSFLIFLVSSVNFISWLRFKKTVKIRNKINYLFDRCTSYYTSEENYGTGSEQFPIVLLKKR